MGDDLSRLVRDRRTELNLSLRSLSDRCADPETGEHPFKYGWLYRLESQQDVLVPKLDDLRALAAGLSLPLRSVQDAAAAQFLGIASSDLADEDTRAVVNRLQMLDKDERRQLLAVVDAYFQNRTTVTTEK